MSAIMIACEPDQARFLAKPLVRLGGFAPAPAWAPRPWIVVAPLVLFSAGLA